MVVAKLYSERWVGGLCTRLFYLLLCHETGDHRVSANPHVLRLHCANGPHILVADWHNRFFRRVRVYKKNICGRQDRLVKIIISRLINARADEFINFQFKYI